MISPELSFIFGIVKLSVKSDGTVFLSISTVIVSPDFTLSSTSKVTS